MTAAVTHADATHSITAALTRARSVEQPTEGTPAPRHRPTGPSTTLPPELDRVLRHSLAAGPGGRLRPVPSAGALHPVDAHLLVGPGSALPAGRYAYHPLTHRLHRRGPAPSTAPPGTLAVLTATVEPTAAHYGHRAWPLLLLDIGHAAAALALGGCPAVCLDAPGPLLAAAARLDATDAPPLAAVRITADCPTDALLRWAVRDANDPTDPTHPIDPIDRTDQPPPARIRPARHDRGADDPNAGEPADTHRILSALGQRADTRHHWQPTPSVEVPESVLLTRRSATPPLLGAPDDRQLVTLLRVAAAAHPDGPSWCAATGGPRPALVHLGDHGRLEALATGDARPTLAVWAARQRWIATTGAVLLAHGCPDDAPPAQVRALHQIAGYAMGHAQLAAVSMGLRSRPIGSWQRADLGAAIGRAPGRHWVLHGLAIGRQPDECHEGDDDPS
ncbi:nitroreductase family protein [Streptomyces sp. NBC_00690]|uniref:nitroreductase family protein n=1 Tax=Streptomyces sp. NBC_00690 TaxID=2975808 RepID=UPI002E2B8402|nr:nitroreductase [Streptomyces sp. NBC_00690]